MRCCASVMPDSRKSRNAGIIFAPCQRLKAIPFLAWVHIHRARSSDSSLSIPVYDSRWIPRSPFQAAPHEPRPPTQSADDGSLFQEFLWRPPPFTKPPRKLGSSLSRLWPRRSLTVRMSSAFAALPHVSLSKRHGHCRLAGAAARNPCIPSGRSVARLARRVKGAAAGLTILALASAGRPARRFAGEPLASQVAFISPVLSNRLFDQRSEDGSEQSMNSGRRLNCRRSSKRDAVTEPVSAIPARHPAISPSCRTPTAGFGII